MALPQHVRLTVQDWLEMPEDGNRYEIIEGVLYVTPPPVPRHQRVVVHFTKRVVVVTEQRELGRWYLAPCGVVLGDGTVVEPDAFFIAKARLHMLVGEKFITGAPDLVVEVLSPGTARRDKLVKYQVYLANCVKEYWVLDPVACSITVYAAAGDDFEELRSLSGDRRIPSRVIPDLDVQPHELFAD